MALRANLLNVSSGWVPLLLMIVVDGLAKEYVHNLAFLNKARVYEQSLPGTNTLAYSAEHEC
jgi:hypothetical protein